MSGIRSEAVAPKCVAEQHRVANVPGVVFLGGKGAPEGRPDAEYIEEIRAPRLPVATRSGPPSRINVALALVPAAIASNTVLPRSHGPKLAIVKPRTSAGCPGCA